jgi:hypothetical protein
MNSSLSRREAWFSFPKAEWNAEGQWKRAVDPGLWPSGMPGSKDNLNDDGIWSVVVYLRHLPPVASSGEPEIYSH